MRDRITLENIRDELRFQDGPTRLLGRKARVNRAIGRLSSRRDNEGKLMFFVNTNKDARTEAKSSLVKEDFK